MPKRVMQGWTTVWGKNDKHAGLFQSEDDMTETAGHTSGIIQTQLILCSSCCLVLEGTDLLDADWITLKEWTQAIDGDVERVSLSRNAPRGSPERLYNFLRWKIHATAAEWETTFRMVATLK